MMMIFQMFGMGRQERQILDPVVQPVAVDMVDNFSPFQFSAKVLFHHDPMFSPSFSALDEHHSIPVVVNTSTAVGTAFVNERIAVSPKSGVMIRAVSASKTSVRAIFDGAFWWLRMFNQFQRVAMPAKTRVMKATKSMSGIFSITSFNRTKRLACSDKWMPMFSQPLIMGTTISEGVMSLLTTFNRANHMLVY